MRTRIYHQLGHNTKWNIESLSEDSTGDGCIIAPRFTEKQKVEAYEADFRHHSFFDPQFFRPDFPKNKLTTYDFFPEIISDGFKTAEFQEKWSAMAAERCVAWQAAQEFEFIVIPCRYLDGMGTDYIPKQEGLFVTPFLAEIQSQNPPQKVLLQIVLNSHLLIDNDSRRDLLNWITGRSGIDGIYLIVEVQKRGKQLREINILNALLTFIDVIRANEMEVVVGYTNTEALLLSIADPTGVTLGSYETTRIFNIRNFEAPDGKSGPPNARIYCSRILNWLNSDYVDTIKKEMPEGEAFFDPTRFQADMFKPTFQWHFTKPQLYRHYFEVFSKQLKEAALLSGRDRWAHVCETLRAAMATHERMQSEGIYLDTDSAPSFLGQWLTVATSFGKAKGWA